MTDMTDNDARLNADHLYRFGLAAGTVRGVAVSLDASWRTAGENHDYPPAVAQLLGQCVAAAMTMVATLKFDGRLILQFRGAGPVTLLVVQAGSDLRYRVTAQWSESLMGDDLDQSIQTLFGAGQLALTIEPKEGVRYQSLVPIEGARIADALEGYFKQSEQLPTRLVLSADSERAVGLLIQQVPGEGGTATVQSSASDAVYEHLSIMVDTLLTPQGLKEFQSTDVPTMLHRLFHQDALVFTQISPVHFYCGCSRVRVGAMLRSLGRDEIDAALKDGEEPGYVLVRCEFCGTEYRFDPVDVEQLLLEDSVSPPDSTRH